MADQRHEFRIQRERLRPLGLPARSLAGLIVTALAALVFATRVEAISSLLR